MKAMRCNKCHPSKLTSIHTGFRTGIFHHCECLERDTEVYPNPAGSKNENSENIFMNAEYMALVGINPDEDYYSKRLEATGTFIARETATEYRRQDKLIMSEMRAMAFVDIDYFFGSDKLQAMFTRKYPLILSNNKVGISYFIDEFPPQDSSLVIMPELANSKVNLTLAELKFVFSNRVNYSEEAAAKAMGISWNTYRSRKSKLKEKLGFDSLELDHVLKGSLQEEILNKKGSVKIMEFSNKPAF